MTTLQVIVLQGSLGIITIVSQGGTMDGALKCTLGSKRGGGTDSRGITIVYYKVCKAVQIVHDTMG